MDNSTAELRLIENLRESLREYDAEAGEGNPENPGDIFWENGSREIKTRRVNLLLKESDYAAWKEAAGERNVSLTAFIETLVNDYLDR